MPWLEPNIDSGSCGAYGEYIGEVGGFWDDDGCTAGHEWSTDASSHAYANLINGYGNGVFGFYFLGGPGADPNYDPSASLSSKESEAEAWGTKQAKTAISEANSHDHTPGIIFLDVEDLDNGEYNGWEHELVHDCSGTQTSNAINNTVARDDVNAAQQYIWGAGQYFPGYYASAANWDSYFSGDTSVAETMEWNADWGPNCGSPGPQNFTQTGCDGSNSATWFGSPPGDCELAWQWASTHSMQYDFDQFEDSRIDECE